MTQFGEKRSVFANVFSWVVNIRYRRPRKLTSLRPDGVGIEPLRLEAATFARNSSDSVVGRGIVELIQQANVSADRIRTESLELNR